MNFGNQLTRIQRMLRDPSGNIWTRSFLLAAYNDIQRDIQRRVRFLESAAVLDFPPRYQMTYMHDWEYSYLKGTKLYQCLRYHQQSDYAYSFDFEPQSEYGFDSAATSAAIATQSWESFVGISCERVGVQFPEDFHTVKFLAFDKTPLAYKTKKAITSADSAWLTREGLPLYYYREADDEFYPYPKPSTISWDDEPDISDPVYVYAYSWESDYVTGRTFAKTGVTYQYIHGWELDLGAGMESYAHGMWLFEADAGIGEMITQSANESAAGVLVRHDGSLISQNLGLTISYLDATDNFLLIYDIEPTGLKDDTDESPFPIFLRKYIEYGVLERAYGSLTDGRLPSLREYWRKRYDLGMEMIKRYLMLRKQDRDYRLTAAIPYRPRKHAVLPSHYPA